MYAVYSGLIAATPVAMSPVSHLTCDECARVYAVYI